MSDPRADLQNPSTPPERLAEIAQQHPELGGEIMAHPACYPELRDWITQYATPAAPAVAPEELSAAQPTTQLPQADAQPTTPFTPADAQPTTPFTPADAQPTTPMSFTQPTAHLGAQPGQPGVDPAQPGFAGQAQAPGTPGFPGGPVIPTGPGQPGSEGAPEKKSRMGLWITIAVVIVVLAAAAVAVWYFVFKGSGSANHAKATSPEIVAENLVSSVTALDPKSLDGSFAPSEIDVFKHASEKLEGLVDDETTQETTEQAEAALKELRGAVDVKVTKDIETEVSDIIEDEVSRVTITDGVIELDGDPEKIAEALSETIYEPLAEAVPQGAPSKKEFHDEIVDSLDGELPVELDFADLDGGDFQLSFVTVKDGDEWYISPMMTIADYAHLAAWDFDADAADAHLGDEVVKPSKAAGTAADAASELTKSIFAGDYDAIVAQMPLAERRVLSIYGPSFFEAAGANPADLSSIMNSTGVKLDAADFSAEEEGDVARISIDKLALSSQQEVGFGTDPAEMKFSLEGTCVSIDVALQVPVDYYSDMDLFEDYLDSKAKSFNDYIEQKGLPLYETQTQNQRMCIDDDPQVAQIADMLGVEDWALVALKEDGGWRISPLATVADIYATTAASAYESLSSGNLAGLLGGMSMLGGVGAVPGLPSAPGVPGLDDLPDFSDF